VSSAKASEIVAEAAIGSNASWKMQRISKPSRAGLLAGDCRNRPRLEHLVGFSIPLLDVSQERDGKLGTATAFLCPRQGAEEHADVAWLQLRCRRLNLRSLRNLN